MHDYVDGKLDWMAAGLPIEGTLAGARAGDALRKDVPTCRLDEQISEARARVEAGDWDFCVVVTEEGIVMGLLRQAELESGEDQPAREVMHPGPNTFRPHVPIGALAHHMAEHDLESALITSSEGRLMGALRREDALQIAHGQHGSER